MSWELVLRGLLDAQYELNQGDVTRGDRRYPPILPAVWRALKILANQTEVLSSDAENIHTTFPNVGLVVVPAHSWGTFNLGKPAWDAIYYVTQVRNSQRSSVTEGTAGVGTNGTTLVDPSKEFHKLTTLIATYENRGNVAGIQVAAGTNLQQQCPVGSIVHNLTTGEWGEITGYVDNWTANVTGDPGGWSGSSVGDILDLHIGVMNTNFRNLTRGATRGITGFNILQPDRFTHANIPGQVPGDQYRFNGGVALWQWDEDGFNVMKPVPIAGSDPPSNSQLNIYNKSDMQMTFIVSWI